MIEHLDTVTLRSGEEVAAMVVIGPEPGWAERVKQLLIHKGDVWNWQNSQVLQEDLGLGVYFYLLHRDGIPFANIMTIEQAGVGLFGHVWTKPEDRQQGASSKLMALQMAHFRQRGGQALFLGTGYDSVAYHIYRRFGFESIEAESGLMHYYTTGQQEFYASYFASGPTEIQALAWSHWPASEALFMGDFPDVVRCASLRLFGRANIEGVFLQVLHREQNERKDTPSMVLQNMVTTAVVGFATWDYHPIWPDTVLLDLYCHPAYWDQGSDLLASLSVPEAQRYIVYSDVAAKAKHQIMLKNGFHKSVELSNRVLANNILVFEKAGG